MKIYGNPDLSKIKTIIFDFDETMYYSPTVHEAYVAYIKKTVMKLTGKDEAEVLSLMDKYGFTSTGEGRVSFGKNCEKFGVTKEQWDGYRITDFFQIDYSTAKIVPNVVYKMLALKYSLYVVSNEVYDNVLYKAEKLNVDLSPFTKIYAPTVDQLKNYLTKSDVYKLIREKEQCAFDEMLVIGDRYAVDIQPLEELGGNGVLIKNVDDITEFFADYGKENQSDLNKINA